MIIEPEQDFRDDNTLLADEAAAEAHANRYADYAELGRQDRENAIFTAASWFHAGQAAREALTHGALWRALSRRFDAVAMRGRPAPGNVQN